MKIMYIAAVRKWEMLAANNAEMSFVLYRLILPMSIPAERDFERVTWLLSREQRQSNAIGRSRLYGRG